MTPADIVIAVLAAGAVIGTAAGFFRRRKKGGCGCGRSDCHGCYKDCDKK